MDLGRKKTGRRLIEIDALRGVAIMLMIVFHLVYDLGTIFDWHAFDHRDIGWRLLGTVAALLFFVLFGISSVFAAQKYQNAFWRFSIRRSAFILFFALSISLFSILTQAMPPIYFGVLHFLGVSALLAPLFLRFGMFNLAFAVVCVLIAGQISYLDSETILLLPLGNYNLTTATADYYPLFPWFGAVLLGIVCGDLLRKYEPFPVQKRPLRIIRLLALLGRHSLLIYFLHQPLLIGILWLFTIFF